MTAKERLLLEIDHISEPVIEEILEFLKKISNDKQQENMNLLLLSESSLNKDWLRPEEDEAWKDL